MRGPHPAPGWGPLVVRWQAVLAWPVREAYGSQDLAIWVALTGQTSNPGAPLMRLLRLNRGDEAAVALTVGRPMTEVSGVVKQIQRRLTLEQQSGVVRRY